MATGDLEGNVERLRRELRRVKLRQGRPAACLPILNHIFLAYSEHIARAVTNQYKLQSSLADVRFVEVAFTVMRDFLRLRVNLTVEQFFKNGWAECKLLLLGSASQACRLRHAHICRQQRLAAIKHFEAEEVRVSGSKRTFPQSRSSTGEDVLEKSFALACPEAQTHEARSVHDNDLERMAAKASCLHQTWRDALQTPAPQAPDYRKLVAQRRMQFASDMARHSRATDNGGQNVGCNQSPVPQCVLMDQVNTDISDDMRRLSGTTGLSSVKINVADSGSRQASWQRHKTNTATHTKGSLGAQTHGDSICADAQESYAAMSSSDNARQPSSAAISADTRLQLVLSRLERRIASLEGDMQTIKALSSSVSFMSDSSNPAARQQPVASPVHGLAMPAASKPSSTEVPDDRVKRSSHALQHRFNAIAHLPEVDNPSLPSTQTQRLSTSPAIDASQTTPSGVNSETQSLIQQIDKRASEALQILQQLRREE